MMVFDFACMLLVWGSCWSSCFVLRFWSVGVAPFTGFVHPTRLLRFLGLVVWFGWGLGFSFQFWTLYVRLVGFSGDLYVFGGD